MQTTCTCRKCGNNFEFEIDAEKFTAWQNGEMLIQDALPDLSAGERELLISGTCDACWKEMFGSMDEEDEDDEEMGPGWLLIEMADGKILQALTFAPDGDKDTVLDYGESLATENGYGLDDARQVLDDEGVLHFDTYEIHMVKPRRV